VREPNLASIAGSQVPHNVTTIMQLQLHHASKLLFVQLAVARLKQQDSAIKVHQNHLVKLREDHGQTTPNVTYKNVS
jgi:hypothetical protein